MHSDDQNRPPGVPSTRKFVIIGLPRSGTTYLMTLLNSHDDVYCTGERYNPYAVVGIGDEKDDSHESVLDRDRDPEGFLNAFFDQADMRKQTHVGFKFMLGHNLTVLQALMARPDLTLIYLWRENRLAQVSSLIKAQQSLVWAQTKATSETHRKIAAGPRKISQHWHELATLDFLFSRWFETAPHARLTVEYQTLFQPGFKDRLCTFLGLRPDRRMKSPLVKQNPNCVLDRFEDPRPINYYFRQIGKAHWLEPEL